MQGQDIRSCSGRSSKRQGDATMKVLVTGAAGQVGCRAVRELLAGHNEIRGVALSDHPCRGSGFRDIHRRPEEPRFREIRCRRRRCRHPQRKSRRSMLRDQHGDQIAGRARWRRRRRHAGSLRLRLFLRCLPEQWREHRVRLPPGRRVAPQEAGQRVLVIEVLRRTDGQASQPGSRTSIQHRAAQPRPVWERDLRAIHNRARNRTASAGTASRNRTLHGRRGRIVARCREGNVFPRAALHGDGSGRSALDVPTE